MSDIGPLSVELSSMRQVATVDERFQSYNIEMAEVIGGNFWKPYDEMDVSTGASADVASTSAQAIADFQIGDAGTGMFQARPPVDLSRRRLRALAAALGPAYVRVSGTWANSVWFHDSDDPAPERPPDGFQGILTRKQWAGVVAFAEAVDAKIVTSFAISQGVRDASGVWTADQAKRILDYTKAAGGSIAAAELFNEPTLAAMGGAPRGYDASMFARDEAVFRSFLKKAAPGALAVGPGSAGEGVELIPASTPMLTSEHLLSGSPRITFDVFSYHFYGAVSQRCASMGAEMTTTAGAALSEEWLSRTEHVFAFYERLRDRFQSGKPIWLTETADAACGGNPWAVTFLDSFRYLDQLGRLARRGVSVHMHNTLASSEYGLIDQSTLIPQPNYWAALLWRRLMGEVVLDAGPSQPGLHLYAHSLRNHPGGIALLAINLDRTTVFTLESPMPADRFTLTARVLDDPEVQLNGHDLALGPNDELPDLEGVRIRSGRVELAPASITFLAFPDVGYGSVA